MATTFTHAALFNSSADVVDLGSHASIDDLSTFTVGLLMRYDGTAGSCLLSKRSASQVGWSVKLQTSGRVDIYRNRATTDQEGYFGSGISTDDAWRWLWVVAQSSGLVVRAGVYGGGLSDISGSVTAGSGAFIAEAAYSLFMGFDYFEGGARNMEVAFIGVWSSALANGTIDSYAADMDGNGGLTAALDYIKFDGTMTAGATSGKGVLTGVYDGATLTTGPDVGGATAAVGSLVNASPLLSLTRSRLAGG